MLTLIFTLLHAQPVCNLKLQQQFETANYRPARYMVIEDYRINSVIACYAQKQPNL